jgi:DNA-binding NtrC family response regulator
MQRAESLPSGGRPGTSAGARPGTPSETPPLRLAAYASDGVRRFDLERGDWWIGCAADATVQLSYDGVSPRHARLRWRDGEAWIEEVPGRRPVLLNGRRIRQAPLALLDEIRIGPVTLVVEELGGPRGRDEAVAEAARAENPAAAGPSGAFDGHLRRLERLADWVLGDAPSRGTAEEHLGGLLRDLGGGAIFLLRTDVEPAGVRLAVASDAAWFTAGPALLAQLPSAPRRGGSAAAGALAPLASAVPAAPLAQRGHFRGSLEGVPCWVVYRHFAGLDRRHVLLAALPPDAEGPGVAETLSVIASLLVLGLVHHVGRYEPLLPSASTQSGLRLAPGLLVGESLATERLLNALAAIAPSSEHVVLRGEAGTGKEAWALTLHLSSPRAGAPFLSLACAGAAPARLDAQLFGAVVAGRNGPLEREGLLTLADGGTLFVDQVDEMPPATQARLLRALRDGEVESASGARRRINPRLVLGTRESLETLATHERFRADLAHAVSRFQVEVPPLRERKAELPLLIQGLVNRFSHETGKRVQGITVDALATLTRYSFPGNWPELENVVRQLVHLCPSGQAIPRSLLPERLRSAEILEPAHRRVSGGDGRGDLSLEALAAATEESAIREALRRAGGNKSQAARLLGLSRNGLAMKMNRLAIPG